MGSHSRRIALGLSSFLNQVSVTTHRFMPFDTMKSVKSTALFLKERVFTVFTVQNSKLAMEKSPGYELFYKGRQIFMIGFMRALKMPQSRLSCPTSSFSTDQLIKYIVLLEKVKTVEDNRGNCSLLVLQPKSHFAEY